MNVEEIDDTKWTLLESMAYHTTVFHSLDWLRLVQAGLGGSLELYLVKNNGRRWLAPCYGGLPWAENGFRIGGIGYGGPLEIERPQSSLISINHIRCVVEELSEKRGQKCFGGVMFPSVEWSGISMLPSGSELYDTCIMELDKDPDFIKNNIISGVKRTSIRKAIKCGVAVEPIRSATMDESYDVLCETQRRVGSPYITPRCLFDRILTLPFSKAIGFCAIHNGHVAAMAVLLTRRNEAFLLFNGRKLEFSQTSANDLLYWSVIEHAIKHGITRLDLGRSHTPGVLNSKLKWGAVIVPVLKYL